MFGSNSVGKSSYFSSSAWEIVTTVIFFLLQNIYFLLVIIEPTLPNMNWCRQFDHSTNGCFFFFVFFGLFVCFSLCRLPLPSKSADWTHFGGKHSHSQKEPLWRAQEEHYLGMTGALSRAPYWHERHVEMLPGWGELRGGFVQSRFSLKTRKRVNGSAPTFKWFPHLRTFLFLRLLFNSRQLQPESNFAGQRLKTAQMISVLLSLASLTCNCSPRPPTDRLTQSCCLGCEPAQISTQNWTLKWARGTFSSHVL